MATIYNTILPVWKFWAKMNRQLTDGKERAQGSLKMNVTKTVTLFDDAGNKTVKGKAKFGGGFTQELSDKDGNPIGVLRKKPVDNRGIATGSSDLWVIEKGGNTHLFMQARRFKDVSPRLIKTDINLQSTGGTVWEIIGAGNKPVGTIVHNTGFNDEWDLVLEDGASEEDRLLCLMMFGYKLHNLIS